MKLHDLGMIDHAAALNRQKDFVRDVAAGAEDALILCEHPKTITLGIKFQESSLFLSREELAKQGFELLKADRGGDVTLHAPGQLVLYPVVDLRRAELGLREYLRKLEQVAVDLLGDFDIVAEGDDGSRGVWISDRNSGHVGRKVASIGIGVSRWVTYHGMGINISTDLSLFRVMRPCGLSVMMTSLEAELKRPVRMDDIKHRAAAHFKRIFGYS